MSRNIRDTFEVLIIFGLYFSALGHLRSNCALCVTEILFNHVASPSGRTVNLHLFYAQYTPKRTHFHCCHGS